MTSAKMATPALRKIKIFWKKGYDVKMSVNDVTNKTLSRDSNSIADLVMWPKIGKSSISMRQFMNSFISIWPKNHFVVGWSWFKFNNLGLTLGTNLKCCTSVAKGLKLKLREFWRLIPTFVEVRRGKLVGGGGAFHLSQSWIRLKGYCCKKVYRYHM